MEIGLFLSSSFSGTCGLTLPDYFIHVYITVLYWLYSHVLCVRMDSAGTCTGRFGQSAPMSHLGWRVWFIISRFRQHTWETQADKCGTWSCAKTPEQFYRGGAVVFDCVGSWDFSIHCVVFFTFRIKPELTTLENNGPEAPEKTLHKDLVFEMCSVKSHRRFYISKQWRQLVC